VSLESDETDNRFVASPRDFICVECGGELGLLRTWLWQVQILQVDLLGHVETARP
jgi:hypothetical protein